MVAIHTVSAILETPHWLRNKEVAMNYRTRAFSTSLVLAGLVFAAGSAQAQVVAEVFATSLSSPLYVTAPDGDDRLFVVEQGGLIRIIDGGTVLPTPFLDLTGLVTFVDERGLLGLAFHPDYAINGFFYVHYSSAQAGVVGDTVVARYAVSGNPDVADAGSAVIMLTEAQPNANHNGGMISFRPNDPNNYLYVALGDGGGAGDPDLNGQDMTTRLGAILRLDVDAGPETAAATNPFVGQAGNDFIWVYGLRNPWRFSFDRDTGDLYIGDVGQGAVEEVDFQAAASAGGENYGWNELEGSSDFDCTDCDGARATTTLPIHEYPHTDGITVVGGYVYRGADIPSLQGTYFFADLSGALWSLEYDGMTVTNFQQYDSSFIPAGNTFVSFGEDGAGELYIVDILGTIYKIVDNTSVTVQGTTGAGFHESDEAVQLSVDITGTTGAVAYSWFKDGSGTPLANGGNISGADTPTLVLYPVSATDSGSYVLQFEDQSKAIFTAPAISITVVAPGSLPLSSMAIYALGVVLCAIATVLLFRRRA